MDENVVEFKVTLKTSDVNGVLNEKRRKTIRRRLELEFGDGKIEVEVVDG
jgi:ribosome-associated protein YbcJ (S4-like RNA binding protein)